MENAGPRVLKHNIMLDAGDSLESLSNKELIGCIRQLSVLIVSSGNRANRLKEQLEEMEQAHIVELEGLHCEIKGLWALVQMYKVSFEKGLQL